MGSQLLSTFFDTHLALILKFEGSKLLKDYRPISLCNVSYKILAKLLVHRLRSLLPNLISSSQATFVPGKHAADHLILAKQMFRCMNGANRLQKIVGG